MCDVGSRPLVGAEVIVNLGLSSLKPPGGSCELPVTNWSSFAISSCVKLLVTDQNHDRTCWNPRLVPLTTECSFRSSKLTVLRPHISSFRLRGRQETRYVSGEKREEEREKIQKIKTHTTKVIFQLKFLTT